MRAKLREQTKKASFTLDKDVGERGISRRSAVIRAELNDNLCRLFRNIWPTKTAQHLALHGEIEQRQAERILSGSQNVTMPVLLCLFDTEHASKFLWAMMEVYGHHSYWAGLRHQLKVANLKESISAQQKELKELEALP